MPINIVCKECKHKQKLTDITWVLQGASSNEETYITCPKCDRIMVKLK